MSTTPHNIAHPGDIAKTVLMPGDPLRARFIAENYLDNPRLFNNVRGMLGYTGLYKGHSISVMGSGMGLPSMGIYSYELFNFYGVDNIVRIGSAGSYTEEIPLYSMVLVDSCWSESTYAKAQSGDESPIQYPDKELNDILSQTADRLNIDIFRGPIHSSDIFYNAPGYGDFSAIREAHGCIGVEMESFSLFHNAKLSEKKAASLLTVSDSMLTMESLDALEREKAFTKMFHLALESAIAFH
ncbi:purine-nucleoside phosphorylase [Eubacterium aggregans]|uniref:purine-nucleoside phosphorylase n=1 Tax=Eubacterium aggregans TaxID=81409 RepID=UPI0023F308F8|nr:purine-nucleoside phosphorylase [Eubacterium aggregans]MDD4690886.1 purine-nucleoside phosphorylase [Eubacterium aggregans]